MTGGTAGTIQVLVRGHDDSEAEQERQGGGGAGRPKDCRHSQGLSVLRIGQRIGRSFGEEFYLACCEECGATGPGADTWFNAGRLWNERRGMGEVHH